MSNDSKNRLTSLLVCWVIHAGLLFFIGLAGLGMGLLGDPSELLSFYEPMFGDAIQPFANLIRLMSSGAVWVMLLWLLAAVAAVGGFLRTGWGRMVLLACTWLHIAGLLPVLLLLHLKVGFSGVVGAIFLLAEMATGIASVLVLKGSLKIIQQTAWGAKATR